MKNFCKYLLLCICISLVSISAFAELKNKAMTISVSPEPEWPVNLPGGPRIPPAPVICTIDFESHRIATSIPYEIIAYELWDEDGTAQIVSFASDYDLVEYMSGMSGAFQLRLVSSERTYVGYIDL